MPGAETKLRLELGARAFLLSLNGQALLSADETKPLLYLGRGEASVEEHRGHFFFEDRLTERIPLFITAIRPRENGAVLEFGEKLRLWLVLDGDSAELTFRRGAGDYNRFWIRLDAETGEHCYGCGEQYSYFDLRGRHFPLWTSEPGVGRDKSAYAWWCEEKKGHHGGGDYYTTYAPQLSYVSSRRYYVNMESSAYADFDFRAKSYHELQLWEIPAKIRIEAADSFPELLKKMTAQTGRQQELPDWVYQGLIVGTQDGRLRAEEILRRCEQHKIAVAGLWCQDWCGQRHTSFGKRVRWNWEYSEELYPDLPGFIRRLHEKGIRFLAYMNPFLWNGGELYREAEEKGFLAKAKDGTTRQIDFGEFYCGLVDLTDSKALLWFQREIIQKRCLDIGIDGWMADFGEYLPLDDICLANGVDPGLEHNRLPQRWAACNFEALKRAGKIGEVLFFMRAGGFGCQRDSMLLWAGDQLVDFSRHNGLPTVVCAALSAAMSGYGLTHSDIGGYTSLHGIRRTRELFLRWAEMAVFTPVMRTHEGNRPAENFQFYDDEVCMERLSRLVSLHRQLEPYLRELVRVNAETGLSVQRPLFLHYDADETAYTVQDEYLLGRDVLVAPVLEEGADRRNLYLPADRWIHLWTGEEYPGGSITVDAPMGKPPVFYRKDSAYAPLFEAMRYRK